MTAVEWWRVLNIGLCVVAWVWLMVDLKSNYLDLSTRRLYLTFSLAAAIFAIGFATFENLQQGNPLGLRVPLSTVVPIWCMFGLWAGRNDPQ